MAKWEILFVLGLLQTMIGLRGHAAKIYSGELGTME